MKWPTAAPGDWESECFPELADFAPADFVGWTQERSTYQAEQLDTHFETPLAMNDTGEKESNGSLAIAKYGKGNFAYVSLVLFRQLPAGVPGAYKLLANLIALPKNK